jgi:hypothetical protein
MLGLAGDTVTEATVGTGGGGGVGVVPDPPPHPATTAASVRRSARTARERDTRTPIM